MVILKGEIKEISLNEGVVQNTLFTCTQMRAGKHHLWDEVVVGKNDDEMGKTLKFEDFN